MFAPRSHESDQREQISRLGPGAKAVAAVAILIGTVTWFHSQMRPPPSDDSIRVCASVGDLAGVKRALDEGISPNADGGAALFLAASSGDVSVTALLLERGADPARVSVGGYTPLMMAA